MRAWDLNTGSANLEMAMESLQAVWSETAAHWTDQRSRDFEQEYLAPLEPAFRRTVDSVHRLAQVLARAERDCGPD